MGYRNSPWVLLATFSFICLFPRSVGASVASEKVDNPCAQNLLDERVESDGTTIGQLVQQKISDHVSAMQSDPESILRRIRQEFILEILNAQLAELQSSLNSFHSHWTKQWLRFGKTQLTRLWEERGRAELAAYDMKIKAEFDRLMGDSRFRPDASFYEDEFNRGVERERAASARAVEYYELHLSDQELVVAAKYANNDSRMTLPRMPLFEDPSLREIIFRHLDYEMDAYRAAAQKMQEQLKDSQNSGSKKTLPQPPQFFSRGRKSQVGFAVAAIVQAQESQLKKLHMELLTKLSSEGRVAIASAVDSWSYESALDFRRVIEKAKRADGTIDTVILANTPFHGPEEGALVANPYATLMELYRYALDTIRAQYPIPSEGLQDKGFMAEQNKRVPGGDFLSQIQPELNHVISMQTEPFENNGTRLHFGKRPVFVEFSPTLGTHVLRSSQLVGNGASANTHKFGAWVRRLEGHGLSTLGSNAASQLNPILALSGLGIESFAPGLPGSMGAIGLSMNSLNTPAEIAAYYRKIYGHENATRELPFVDNGRSMAATYGFNAALFEFLSGGEGLESSPNLVVAGSFSNPGTIDKQMSNVGLQVGTGGFVQGIVPGAFKSIGEFSQRLLSKLESSRSRLDGFGRKILFAQGRADVDSSGSENVVEEVKAFRDRYAPAAMVYEFEDPLLDRPDLAKQIDADEREASHMLQLPMRNVTRAMVEEPGSRWAHLHEFPDHLLPQFVDQFYEYQAMVAMGLDLQIDVPILGTQDYFVSERAKQEVARLQRQRITGSSGPEAYFRHYLKLLQAHFIAKRQVDFAAQLDFDAIMAPAVLEGRAGGIPGRMKKVVNRFRENAQRLITMQTN